jgi:hypothetical protein
MFFPGSRYEDVDEATTTLPDGREVRYKRRRMVPPAGSYHAVGEERVEAADRLDLISARALGDPEHFWRICDANDVLDPDDLLVEGRRLMIPLPRP